MTDDDWARPLGAIRPALRPGDFLAFETRRPEYRDWEQWAAASPVTPDIPGTGAAERHLEVTSASLPLVSFRYTYTFLTDGADRQAPDRPGRELAFIARHATRAAGPGTTHTPSRHSGALPPRRPVPAWPAGTVR